MELLTGKMDLKGLHTHEKKYCKQQKKYLWKEGNINKNGYIRNFNSTGYKLGRYMLRFYLISFKKKGHFNYE